MVLIASPSHESCFAINEPCEKSEVDTGIGFANFCYVLSQNMKIHKNSFAI